MADKLNSGFSEQPEKSTRELLEAARGALRDAGPVTRNLVASWIDKELAKPVYDLPNNALEVGLSRDLREVIVNHPEMTPTPGGKGGHIVFTPQQAKEFAALMAQKASECLSEP